MQRREFIKTAAVTTGAALGAAHVLGAQATAAEAVLKALGVAG